jgi:hypothetical protein
MPSTPDGVDDRAIQVDSDDGPWDEPLNHLTDGVKTAAVFATETGKDDKLAALWRDGADLRFRDETNPGTAGGGYTLAELLAGGSGLTEEEHEDLDTLTHDIAEDSYDEVIRTGGRVSQIITWDSAAKTKKIREEITTRSGGLISQSDIIQYDDAGVESYRLTEVYTRTGGIITAITRTRT